jgi:hypothetical protein
MPINDLVYNSDLAQYQTGSSYGEDCGCHHKHHDKDGKDDCYFIPPPPPPYPPYAWLVPPPPPRYPYPPVEEQEAIKQNETEKQICKLSKQAATLRTLIENIEDKNKSTIIKSSAASYNLGSLKKKDPEDPETEITDESIATIVEILKAELEKVKDEIKDLSDKLVEE